MSKDNVAMKEMDKLVVNFALEKKLKSRQDYSKITTDPIDRFIGDWMKLEEQLLANPAVQKADPECLQFAKQKFNILCQRAYSGLPPLLEEEIATTEPKYVPFKLWENQEDLFLIQ